MLFAPICVSGRALAWDKTAKNVDLLPKILWCAALLTLTAVDHRSEAASLVLQNNPCGLSHRLVSRYDFPAKSEFFQLHENG